MPRILVVTKMQEEQTKTVKRQNGEFLMQWFNMKKFNISIIVMDTMRLDTFNTISRTKGMELSKVGNFTYFDNCIAPSTWTLPVFAARAVFTLHRLNAQLMPEYLQPSIQQTASLIL